MRLARVLLSGCLISGLGLAAKGASPAAPGDRAAASEIIAASTSKAVRQLYSEVSRLSLAPNLTVGQYVRHMDCEEEFLKYLQRADQIGGPRWIDPYTVQVQLQIPAARVSQALKQFAGAYPKRSPLTAAQIEMASRQWPAVIGAMGSTAESIVLKAIRPRPGPPWSFVSDRDREQALEAANAAAVEQSIEAVSPVKLADSRTLGEALADPSVQKTVRDWLVSRPVSNVNFCDDLQVEVTLSVDERAFFEQVRTAIRGQTLVPMPQSIEQWRQVERDFFARFRPATGRATAARGVPVTQSVLTVPRKAPEWAVQKVEIVGQAEPAGSKLRARMQAEADARAKLRQRLESLQLEKDLTVGDAVRQSPRIAENLAAYVEQVRPYRTEYQSDGGAAVYLQADLGELWARMAR
jgi:hypothetical protein